MGTLAQPNFDALIATTLQNYNRKATPQILSRSIIWYKLKERGRITNWDGGRTIVEPLLSAESTAIKMIRGYEEYDTTPQEGITAAEFEAKQMVGVVSISGIEEALNSGSREKVVDLLETKMEQLDTTYTNKLGVYAFADGSADGGRHFNGFDVMIENGGTWGTYGTIDRNAADGSGDFWRNLYTAAGDSFDDTGQAKMRTFHNTLTIGNDEPDLYVTSQGIHEEYEKELTANVKFEFMQARYDKKLGDIGFAALLFKNVPFVYDVNIDSGLTDGAGTAQGATTVLGLNTKFIAFRALKGRNMVLTPFVKPINQDARLAARLFYGNFVCNSAYRQGRLLFSAVTD